MSEIINNSSERVKKLKKLLLNLHEGKSVEETKKELSDLFGKVPYGEVVTAEQELINEGMPPQEIQKYCDLHSGALKDHIDLTVMKDVEDGHPVHTLRNENRAIETELGKIRNIFIKYSYNRETLDVKSALLEIRQAFNNLTDIEKHYVKKENLLFSYLEKYGITGPSTVMWGKDDEVRGLLKSVLSVLSENEDADSEVLGGYIDLLFRPAVDAVSEMIIKEEKILFPMCLERFTDIEWYGIYRQSDEIGYCLYEPSALWRPEGVTAAETEPLADGNRIKLSSGSFTVNEIEGLLNAVPFDITYVDKEDKVRFFSHGSGRIFERRKAILGRQVQYCHPPSSVHIVDKILDDFKSGRQDSAKFWINFKGKYVHIAYYAVRSESGSYLGTVEVTQDIAEYRNIEGERRLLTYDK